MKYCIVDDGYKTPAIAKMLLVDGITPVFLFKRPLTKERFLENMSMYMTNIMMHTFVTVIISCIIVPPTERNIENTKVAEKICLGCQYLSMYRANKDYVKIITRHVWEDYMETCEDIHHTTGMKDLYSHRREAIERIFGTAKENHGFRYTKMYRKARMKMKVTLTFACMNLKKLEKCKQQLALQMA